jgi:hypothetical protein
LWAFSLAKAGACCYFACCLNVIFNIKLEGFMKRIAALLLAAACCLFGVYPAQADGIDLKVRGEWDFAFGWASHVGFRGSVHGDAAARNDDNIIARQRIRTQIDFVASESLKGVLMFEIGDFNWGNKEDGGALDADGKIVKVKRAYLDWMVPETDVSVRMGIQGITLPSTPMGTPVLDTDVAAVVVSAPLAEWLSVTALWARPFDASSNDGDDRHYADEVDIFGLLLPFSGKGWSFTPWGLYGFVGANSGCYNYLFTGEYDNTVSAENSRAKAWWLGAHLEFSMLEPLTLNVEGIYGALNSADLDGLMDSGDFDSGMSTRQSASGWFLAATLDYQLDWATPGLFGWWSSGDKANSDHSGRLGRMPVLSNAESCFAPTSFGYSGTFNIGTDTLVSTTGVGTWGVGVQIADMTFVEDLTHTLRFAYYEGTNDADLIKKTSGFNYLRYAADTLYLTDKDSVFEVNFNHTYQIYENLVTVLELGYLHLDADKGTWSEKTNKQRDETKNAWKAQLMFQYSF